MAVKNIWTRYQFCYLFIRYLVYSLNFLLLLLIRLVHYPLTYLKFCFEHLRTRIFFFFLSSTFSISGFFWTWTFLTEIPQRVSIGFRLRLNASHRNNSIPRSWNQFFVLANCVNRSIVSFIEESLKNSFSLKNRLFVFYFGYEKQ